jgi:hypothetical protein
MLRCVAVALGCEAVSGDLVTLASTTTIMIAWLAPSICTTSLGLSLALRQRWIAAMFAVCQGAAYTIAGTCRDAVAAIAATSYAIASAELARRMRLGDVEKTVVLAMLSGNVAAFVLMTIFGIDEAYAGNIVSTSNDLTHLTIAGLVLWAMRR